MNATQMSAALSLAFGNDHWGVTGPFPGPTASGTHLRVWLNNGYGIMLLDNSAEMGRVDAILIQHADEWGEGVFLPVTSQWEFRVTVEKAEDMLRSVMVRPGRMVIADSARG